MNFIGACRSLNISFYYCHWRRLQASQILKVIGIIKLWIAYKKIIMMVLKIISFHVLYWMLWLMHVDLFWCLLVFQIMDPTSIKSLPFINMVSSKHTLKIRGTPGVLCYLFVHTKCFYNFHAFHNYCDLLYIILSSTLLFSVFRLYITTK